MLTIPHSKITGEKGTWWRFGESVVLSCPKCGISFRLNHTITEDGIVTPSVVCPISSCKFHDYIKLGEFS